MSAKINSAPIASASASTRPVSVMPDISGTWREQSTAGLEISSVQQ